MLIRRKIKVGAKYIEGFLMKMGRKNLIILRGSRGYVMCGYLNMKVAEKCKDAAIKVTGVSSIQEALNASVHSCTSLARKMGVRKGRPVKEILKFIV